MKNNWLNGEAARMIQEGVIGDVMGVMTSMEFPYHDGVDETAFANFRYTETDSQGGGAAWDVGPHNIYMAMMLAGAEKIMYVIGAFGKQIHGDDKPHQSIYMLFGMDNEVVGTSYNSFTSWLRPERREAIGFEGLQFEVIGTEGRLEGYGTMFQHSETCGDNDQRIVLYTGKGGKQEIRTPVDGVTNIYAMEFDRLAQPIVEGSTPPIATEAVSLVGVIESAIYSAGNENMALNTDKFFDFQL